MSLKNFLLLLIIVLTACRQQQKQSTVTVEPGITKDATTILPNGWKITPAGRTLSLGDLPLNMVISPDGHYLVATNNGYSHPTLNVVSLDSETVTQSLNIPDAWLGLAFDPSGKKLFVSGGFRNFVYVLNFLQGKLSLVDSIVLAKPWPVQIAITGICVSPDGKTLYAVTRENNSLYAIDISGKKIIARLPLPGEAYTCLTSGDGKTVYISVWGKAEVLTYSTSARKFQDSIITGNHPNSMALTKDDRVLFVSNANDNTVSVIDLNKKKAVATINAAVHPTDLAGSTPNALSLSADQKYLYVANADNNCLAVMNVSDALHPQSAGFIPTGWYPTAVATDASHIYVANGKGNISFANPEGPQPGHKDSLSEKQYIGRLLKGSLSVVDFPSQDQLKSYTEQVFRNTRFENADSTHDEAWTNDNPIPKQTRASGVIKHVFYIIKENRTYDQVLGDVREGNGDSSLCLFPEKITPNLHAVARSFVLLDNFYVDAEVSADGHNWSMAGYATDYTEKTWPALYGDRGGDYPYEGGREIVKPAHGYIWDYCARNKVSYRTYGEFADSGNTAIPVLEGHAPINYPGFNLDIYDTTRERLWEKDFDSLMAMNAVPQFQTIRLGNDHTSGARPGKHTPVACAADNDVAVGLFLDHLSHSKIWNESVVFILEDDAQDGPDHVDAHRTTAYIAGGFVKRHYVDHTMYSTSSVLHTMELILGLPPMSQYDASATPLWRCFVTQADPTPYQVQNNEVPLDSKNPAGTKLAALSSKIDLSEEDRVPDDFFSMIIWKAVRGEDADMPAIHHAAFVFPVSETSSLGNAGAIKE